jgi:hypothetical protein
MNLKEAIDLTNIGSTEYENKECAVTVVLLAAADQRDTFSALVF